MRRVFIPNRGEIAVRIIRACHELGLEAYLGASEPDRQSLAARLSDGVVVLGPAPVGQSYLDLERVIAGARSAGADALHPGYGLLSERPELAEACEKAGLTFVGPPAAAMRLLGDKLAAREAGRRAGVPVLAGSREAVYADDPRLGRLAASVGFPLAVKAAAGGGGRGIRIVASAHGLREAVVAASREAQAYFGDGRVYLERYWRRVRHIEVQVVGDLHGQVAALGERDCSVQRRHQKLVEEAPAPRLGEGVRQRLARAAVRVARAAGYSNAGTAEFLLTAEGPAFLEMNARLQVEHPVTELVWGVDLVQAQLRLAAGERLRAVLGRPAPRGHAIEVRVNAEDPARDFHPAPGRITLWQPPAGPGVRVDSGVSAGDEVSDQYDSLLAKLCVWGEDRPRALARLRRALDEFLVEGVPTTLEFARGLLELPAFQRGGVPTSVAARVRLPPAPVAAVLSSSPPDPSGTRRFIVEVEGEVLSLTVRAATGQLPGAAPPRAAPAGRPTAKPPGVPGEVRAPLAGTVLKLAAQEGSVLSRGDLLCVIEAMKMENEVRSPWAGRLHSWRVGPGSRVDAGAALCSVAQT